MYPVTEASTLLTLFHTDELTTQIIGGLHPCSIVLTLGTCRALHQQYGFVLHGGNTRQLDFVFYAYSSLLFTPLQRTPFESVSAGGHLQVRRAWRAVFKVALERALSLSIGSLPDDSPAFVPSSSPVFPTPESRAPRVRLHADSWREAPGSSPGIWAAYHTRATQAETEQLQLEYEARIHVEVQNLLVTSAACPTVGSRVAPASM